MPINRRQVLAAVPFAASSAAAQGRRGGRLGSWAANYSPLAGSDAEKKILAVIEEMEVEHKTYLSVPRSDGRWLRVLAETALARRVVEIGTSTGYSGLWFALALIRTGGKLTTFELDPGRANTARGHFRQAGVDGLVTVVVGDAHQNIRKVSGPVDVAFLDADKEGYVAYLETLLPHIRSGGLVLAHNVEMSARYVEAVTANPALETVFFLEGGGLGVTLKKV